LWGMLVLRVMGCYLQTLVGKGVEAICLCAGRL
jgi:hypothetical protein